MNCGQSLSGAVKVKPSEGRMMYGYKLLNCSLVVAAHQFQSLTTDFSHRLWSFVLFYEFVGLCLGLVASSAAPTLPLWNKSWNNFTRSTVASCECGNNWPSILQIYLTSHFYPLTSLCLLLLSHGQQQTGTGLLRTYYWWAQQQELQVVTAGFVLTKNLWRAISSEGQLGWTTETCQVVILTTDLTRWSVKTTCMTRIILTPTLTKARNKCSRTIWRLGDITDWLQWVWQDSLLFCS